ncbi:MULTISPECIES: CDP-alcohol phosphatidyltransferase family protein [unclassified Sinorhizobium]|uniref:CDP-alcohol phosphatidyltransferase family protein n=1 Tax=unclassified Sinorhizobium TaxID=2613772 RepID=UPI0035254C66
MAQTGDRRPLASRDAGWAKAVARVLAARSIPPNRISQASMAAAALAGGSLFLAGETAGLARPALLIAGALFCQIRLLCNLFDGMVAIEGGKAEPDGPFWNEFPDRVADLLIFIGAGYGIDAPGLGWAAAAFAIFTAYVRELGHALSEKSDFSGPMAKPHRMAIMTAAAVLSAFETLWHGRGEVLTIALWIVAAGSAVTVLRRSSRLLGSLRTT